MQSTLFSVIIKEKNNLKLIQIERRYLMIKSEKSCTWEYDYKKDVKKVIEFLENKSSEKIVEKIDFGSEYRKPFSNQSLYKNEHDGRAEKVEKLTFKMLAYGNVELLYSFWAIIQSILFEFNSKKNHFELVKLSQEFEDIFSDLFSNCFSEDEKKIILSFIFKTDDVQMKLVGIYEARLTDLIGYYLRIKEIRDGYDNEILNLMFGVNLKIKNNQASYSLFFDLNEEKFKIFDTSTIYEIYGNPYEGDFEQYLFIARESEVMVLKDLESFKTSLLNKDTLPFFSNLMKYLSKYILRDYQGYQIDDKMFESVIQNDPESFKTLVRMEFDKIIKRNFELMLLNKGYNPSHEICYDGYVPAYPELYQELKDHGMVQKSFIP